MKKNLLYTALFFILGIQTTSFPGGAEGHGEGDDPRLIFLKSASKLEYLFSHPQEYPWSETHLGSFQFVVLHGGNLSQQLKTISIDQFAKEFRGQDCSEELAARSILEQLFRGVTTTHWERESYIEDIIVLSIPSSVLF